MKRNRKKFEIWKSANKIIPAQYDYLQNIIHIPQYLVNLHAKQMYTMKVYRG
jgi:hypothetical protein